MSRGLSSWSAWGSASAFFLTGLFPLFNADAYGHLAQGREIESLGRVPEVDPFSFWKPEPQPWSNYEWGYDLMTWLVYDRFGASALVLLKCALLALLGYLLVRLAERLADGATHAAPLAFATLALALPVARFRFTARPELVGLLFSAVLLLGIAALFRHEPSERSKRWTLAGLASMHVVWVNMHASHLFGLTVGALFTAFAFRASAFRWMWKLLVLQAVATSFTPFGPSIVVDAIAHVFDPRYRELVVEWGPWSPRDPLRLLVAPAIAASLVVLTMRPVVRASRYGLSYGVLCVLLSLMAFRSMRFVAQQLLFCAPFVAAGLARTPLSSSMRRAVPVFVVLALVGSSFWMTRLVPRLGFGLGESKRAYPWASGQVVEEAVREPRILASIEDSWFLMFAVPSGKLLIDGRVPFFGPDMIRHVGRSFADETLLASLVEELDINTVLIDNTRSDHVPAAEYLNRRRDWVLGFVEDGHSLFVRGDAAGRLSPFEIIGPGYRTGRLLDSRVPDAAVRDEVERLGSQVNTRVVHAWHQGLETLRPLARDDGRAGLRMYRTAAEQARAREAYEHLSVAARRFPGFTTIELFRSMAALAACDVAEAREALGRAMYGGQSRATVLVSLELSLRAGTDSERSAALAELRRLRIHPESRDDPWVAAIAREVSLRCPGS